MADRADNATGRIVSSETEQLILVDADDNAVGHASKADCHDGDGVLHRAFSLFVFNPDGALLLQQRSAAKRLWPLYWSNSCCSHPRRGETMNEAVERRLQQELRIGASLEFLYKFRYQARYGDHGSEHELCSVYAGTTRDNVDANPTEIAAWRYVMPDDVDIELAGSPERFTPWFRLEWQRLRNDHAALFDTAGCASGS